MKVILVNGSPHKHGCTYTALCEVAETLQKEGVETEIFWVGNKPLSGCLGCQQCMSTGRCFMDDTVNRFLDKAGECDGFVFGTPVHFASASGAITSFMDRAFYGRGNLFANKPAAAIASCRRGGATATFDQLNKYFTISNMPVVSSQYWNMVHGNRQHARRGAPRCRRASDHAHAGTQHGVAAEVHRSGQAGGHPVAVARAEDSYQLHPLSCLPTNRLTDNATCRASCSRHALFPYMCEAIPEKTH